MEKKQPESGADAHHVVLVLTSQTLTASAACSFSKGQNTHKKDRDRSVANGAGPLVWRMSRK